MSTYDVDVQRAICLLNQGKRTTGLEMLEGAIKRCPERFEAHHLKAITLRLMGPVRFHEAEEAFATARSRASSNFDAARIDRDHGQLKMDGGAFEEAHRFFKQSLELLKKAETASERPEETIWLEREATNSFLGLLRYEQGDRLAGLNLLRSAVQGLDGHQPYELNARIRLMKAESLVRRLAMTPKTFYQSIRAKHVERCLEVLLLCFGGARLHRRLLPAARQLSGKAKLAQHTVDKFKRLKNFR
ncbi:MAG TPA: hypothetical protein VD907_04620 [Verrucomicrobiae bacterium]|nr:hypothetical protein [Verrucomicrobiae bacterium]